METNTTQENSEACAGLAAATGYAALVAKLESELQEIADAKGNAGANQEWKRYDRLCGAQDTLLGIRMWMRRNPPAADERGGCSVQRMIGPHRLAILGVAQVATEEMLAAQLRLRSVEQIKDNIIRSAYWSDFMAAARAGAVQEDWLPGALGRVVLGWAKNGAHAANDASAATAAPEAGVERRERKQ